VSEYVSLATLLELPLQKFKDELAALGVFTEINEGEEIYTGVEPWAMVIPGADHITLEGNQQLLHKQEIFVLFLQASASAPLSELRKTAEQGFNALMVDQRHGDTCWNCLPTRWAPGFYSLGDSNFAGVQTKWEVRNYQTFIPPEQGNAYTSMENLVETVLAEIKVEVASVSGIDEVSEGEHPYPGAGTVSWVIPGPDRIQSFNRAKLGHSMTVYQNLVSSLDLTLAEMRAIGQRVYDKMMVDITHNNSCLSCLPRLWNPGFLQYGEQSFVGVESIWEATMLHAYTPT